MHGPRTALRYSPSTYSPSERARVVGAQSYPLGAGGPLHRRPACRWRCVGRRMHSVGSESPHTRILVGYPIVLLLDVCVCAPTYVL